MASFDKWDNKFVGKELVLCALQVRVRIRCWGMVRFALSSIDSGITPKSRVRVKVMAVFDKWENKLVGKELELCAYR
jgi:hypothetical protein